MQVIGYQTPSPIDERIEPRNHMLRKFDVARYLHYLLHTIRVSLTDVSEGHSQQGVISCNQPAKIILRMSFVQCLQFTFSL